MAIIYHNTNLPLTPTYVLLKTTSPVTSSEVWKGWASYRAERKSLAFFFL